MFCGLHPSIVQKTFAMSNYAHLCQQALPIIKTTGAFIRTELGRVSRMAIEEKSLNSLVSYVDRQAEEQRDTNDRHQPQSAARSGGSHLAIGTGVQQSAA